MAPGQKAYGGIVETVVLTVKDEGFLALYRGATPTLLGAVPYEGIKFGTVGILELWFPLPPNEDGSLPKPTPLRKMLFGGLGGIMAGLLTYPNDTVVRAFKHEEREGRFVCSVRPPRKKDHVKLMSTSHLLKTF